MRVLGLFVLFVVMLGPSTSMTTERPGIFLETPMFEAAVAAGKLPPVKKRLPEEPFLLKTGQQGFQPGKHGGSLRLLMGRKKDTRQLVVYGYARLVGYDKNFNFVPDILKKFEVKHGRIFTLHLRKGHRWSDGHPFTSEDFRYYFEDVATNKKIANESLPQVMLVEGKPPLFEVLDKHTVRYTWHKPNPFILPRLAGARPIYLYRPAHYLKKFHIKYTPLRTLEVLVKKAKKRNWVALHYIVGQQYKNVNPELPSLQPWVLVTKPPAKRFNFLRNPYYHRVDMNGRQLPYINDVKVNVTSSKLIPIKAGAGETDLQSRGLNFTNYTLLKKSEKKFGYSTKLWRTAKGARWAIYPNLNFRDMEWRKLFRNVNFRRALSIAIDRHEINQVFYYGLARETNNSVLRESPLFDEKFANRWSQFDLNTANQMLDDLGLVKRNSKGFRLLPNGQPMELTVVFSTEEDEPSDILELVSDTWRKIGIKVLSKPLHREVMRNRIFSGNVQMSIWSGLENGIPNASSSPAELAPTSQQQLQWPMWGQYLETGGKSGQAIDMKVPQKLFELKDAWREARSEGDRIKIWHEMLDTYTSNVFSIGIIASVPQVVLVNSSLQNVPDKAIYNWDPGAHFGIYRPCTFWFDSVN
ncbi:MAG TPA: ABC transporter substrate-binding protein [Rhodospirillales bacterium]|nr:ABC transporter substrate-binding protein [Rhodospirillales bacterium]HIP09835.1 ABC transporter substrate-binding protein [Rhodospirillales bacterium]